MGARHLTRPSGGRGRGAGAPPSGEGPAASPVRAFRAAGRALSSLGLVRGAEGNLSTFDGRVLRITRTGSALADLHAGDVVEGLLEDELPGASSDLEVHRRAYRVRGPGAVVHAHPPGTVPEDGGGPGRHGAYEFGSTLAEAVERVTAPRRPPGGEPARGSVRAVEWRDGVVRILDQASLPRTERYLEATTPAEVARAIRSMSVRGAPLLGIAAAYGVALAAWAPAAGAPAVLRRLDRAGRTLVASRPTAANIAWAVDRVLRAAGAAARDGPEAIRGAALREALAVAAEDEAACRAIGEHGAELVPAGSNVLTHCNTGALATGGWGSAQGVIVAAHRAGKRVHVWVDETRPVLQGARLTAWELRREGVPMTLVADVAAGSLMGRGLVDLVVVGADRIAANGDVANKVGTYPLAVLARHHRIPFYVAAPVSTIDPGTATGGDVVIEERSPAEVLAPLGVHVAPRGTRVANPAFDVTPAGLVTAIVTEKGVLRPPYRRALGRALAGSAAR